MLLKAGTIVAQFQPFEQVQVSKLSVESATSNASAPNSSSISVGLHTTCAMQQESSNLQQIACSVNHMPTYLEPLFKGATDICDADSQRAQIREILIIYGDIFSRTSSNVGRTDLI